MEDKHVHLEVVIERLDGLERLMDTRLGAIEKHLERMNGRIGTSEERIGALVQFKERAQVYFGIAALIGTGALALIFERINEWFNQ